MASGNPHQHRRRISGGRRWPPIFVSCSRRPCRQALAGGVAELEYILTTANNWRGPIGRFHLTIDKGKPANIVSLCWPDLRKTGPTTFEWTGTNFVPRRDIALLIFDGSGAPR